MIGLLGGSFDPVHHGHLIVARTLLEALGLSELRFVVAREQPLKQQHIASPEQRTRMVKLAIGSVPQFKMERIELDRAGPSYTVDTLRLLKAREPRSEFIVLLGADAARDLDRWKEADEVARLAQIVVFGRAGEPPPTSALIGRQVIVPGIEISATAIRQRVKQGLPIRYLVPDQVAEYIRQNQLYL
jgi:nicotinate-nucleotide adenylyltransferase